MSKVLSHPADEFVPRLPNAKWEEVHAGGGGESDSDSMIPGERVVGELVDASIALLPMAVDPHGK